MRWCVCKSHGIIDYRSADAPPARKPDEVRISESVGLGGVNSYSDVLKIQQLLDKIPKINGGPAPLLATDGICGPLTRGAILDFQKKQFPANPQFHDGWRPDGRVDPGKWTIDKMNVIANWGSRTDLLEIARKQAPVARARVMNALHRLSVVRSSYALPSPLFSNAQLKREADWHFKFHKAAYPLENIDAVSTIYQRMNAALTKFIAGSFPLFQLSDHYREDALAYAHVGGYSFSIAEIESGEQGAYIYVANERFGSLPVIIHELGHYCGGRFRSGREIDHVSTPHPKPNGAAREAGRHDYRRMTPQEALKNVYSYQVYALPEMGYGPPESGQI
ncbi:peptidoglycan-binding domain-containing protein [Methylosinus sp. LW3]|uniref:peptidoglycan-binding domain-containing protein n=1 Tax=Methylosinus sp. LW3 TaxID=107635 RepID=UPI0004632CB1|nr:peptidoglycan-binding domain-containing protein [Methylosinus sp. LW3]